MPTGVVDAFKNLIRHGKHHNHNRDNNPPKQNEPDSASKSMPQEDSPSIVSPSPREAAQIIVDEERHARSKMPKYQGLENFDLVDKMGDGAFSNVYKGIDLRTNAKVAVKVVRKYELNASQTLTSTFSLLIVLLFPLARGISENLSRHVILQVAQGIRYLHEERGVVHRDIKPENLLFERIPIIPSNPPIERRPYDEEKEDEGEFIPGVGGGGIGRVKIADFGLSKVVWNEETMTPCGTVGYTAPEIVKDERYSKSVDMWALGCVLYTLLCGFPPFYDESINMLTEKVARGQYTFLSPWWDDVSHSAKDLITHLLCVDPSQRYTIDEFLVHPWCTASPAPPPPPTPLIYGNPPNSAIPYASFVPLDSPLLSAARGGRGYEGRSPGVATLKEAFDITYAVHRMEEEGARRRKYNGPGGVGLRGFLGGLNEDDEDDTIEEEYHGSGRTAGVAGIGASSAQQYGDVGTAQHDQGVKKQVLAGGVGATGASRRAHKGGFQLDLDGATLLGRRHRKAGAVPVVSSPLSGRALGSPLRMEDLRVGGNELPASPMPLG
ncbi:hypothetical protein H0H81_010135 [Sphagnurus paluster]|uniref:Protein kinase domain-containing protein n=1 Tax=Sphagnurus paluster TaxID=117069 RepID=A0A9P7K4C5_9AGAR|nr:hypothetical protein H0H81_010135 [Sphagnurus paluster]